MLVIKPVANHQFDVFWGQGWENWCRFSNDKRHLKKLAGNSLPKDEMKALWGILNDKR